MLKSNQSTGSRWEWIIERLTTHDQISLILISLYYERVVFDVALCYGQEVFSDISKPSGVVAHQINLFTTNGYQKKRRLKPR